MEFDFQSLVDLHLPDEAKVTIADLCRKLRCCAQGPWSMDPPMATAILIRGVRAYAPLGIVPSCLLAQVIDESGWMGGTQGNLLGIKATGADRLAGNAMFEVTHEVTDAQGAKTYQAAGDLIRVDQLLPDGKQDLLVKAWFYSSPRPMDHLDKYALMIQNRAAHFGLSLTQFFPDQRVAYLRFLQQAPAYATGENYESTQLQIIEDNDLACLDF